MTPVEKFLRSHNQAISQIDIDQLIKAFLAFLKPVT